MSGYTYCTKGEIIIKNVNEKMDEALKLVKEYIQKLFVVMENDDYVKCKLVVDGCEASVEGSDVIPEEKNRLMQLVDKFEKSNKIALYYFVDGLDCGAYLDIEMPVELIECITLRSWSYDAWNEYLYQFGVFDGVKFNKYIEPDKDISIVADVNEWYSDSFEIIAELKNCPEAVKKDIEDNFNALKKILTKSNEDTDINPWDVCCSEIGNTNTYEMLSSEFLDSTNIMKFLELLNQTNDIIQLQGGAFYCGVASESDRALRFVSLDEDKYAIIAFFEKDGKIAAAAARA